MAEKHETWSMPAKCYLGREKSPRFSQLHPRYIWQHCIGRKKLFADSTWERNWRTHPFLRSHIISHFEVAAT
jgi:hypothetical protein